MVVVQQSLFRSLVVGQQSLFRSVPTTVKTSENDTVLLPCYVDNLEVSTGCVWEDSKLLVFLTLCCVQVVTRRSQGLVVGGQQVAGVLDVVLCAGGHKVRWWWGSKLLVDSSDPDVTLNSRIKIFPNNTLQVSDLRAEDTGEYKCQVIRPKPWGLMEQLHAIEVLYPPSVVPHPGTGLLEVQLGGDVDMGCEAKGVPKPIITWTNRHGDEMQLLDHRPRLRFRADDRQLSGTYTCVAINGVGEPANATIHLRILCESSRQGYPHSVSLDLFERVGTRLRGLPSNALTVVAMEGGFQVLQYLREFKLENQVGDPKLSPSRVPLAGVSTGGGGEGVWPWRSR
uniref:Ig-like domain-containing protein n=1 Tax=Timema tahoe TaxID=61484 RepID=A0A7R9IHX7_9NEOP|nr:unnamed protein product [Timema tahoe]